MKKFRLLGRKTPGETILHLIVSAVFAIIALSYVYMFFWAVMSACKTHTEIIMNPFALPKKWHWDHFIEVISSLEVNGHGFWEMLFNSCFFSVGGALLQTFVTITFAYCCTMYKFPGSNLPYTIILVIMTLPIYGAGGATYALYRELGMVDSYWHIICSAAGMTGSFLPQQPITRGVLSNPANAIYFQTEDTYAIDKTVDGNPMLIILRTPEGYAFAYESSYVFAPEYASGDLWVADVTAAFDGYRQFARENAWPAGEYAVQYVINGCEAGRVTFTLE